MDNDLPTFETSPHWSVCSSSVRADLEDSGQSKWFYAPVEISRDSGIRETSNWAVAIADLERLSIEHVVHRFGHWACGWIESLYVADTPEGETWIRETAGALADYPILSDEDYSEREWEAGSQAWDSFGYQEWLRAQDIGDLARDVLEDSGEASHIALRFCQRQESWIYEGEEPYAPSRDMDRGSLADLIRAVRTGTAGTLEADSL